MFALHDVWKKIENICNDTRIEYLDTLLCLGRVVAQDIKAKQTYPLFNISGINGYALKLEDTELPTSLKILSSTQINTLEVQNNNCTKVLMGLPIPKGANTVLSLNEVTTYQNNIIINNQFYRHQNIRYTGMDINLNDIIIKKNTTLSPTHVSIAKLFKNYSLPVYKKLTIGFATHHHNKLLSSEELFVQNENFTTSINYLTSFIASKNHNSLNLGKLLEVESKEKAEEVIKFIMNQNEMNFFVIISDMNDVSINSSSEIFTKLSELGVETSTYNIAAGYHEKIEIAFLNNKIILFMPHHFISFIPLCKLFIEPILNYFNKLPAFTFDNAYLAMNLDENDKLQDFLLGKVSVDSTGKKIATPYTSQDFLVANSLVHANCIIIIDKLSSLTKDSEVQTLSLN